MRRDAGDAVEVTPTRAHARDRNRPVKILFDHEKLDVYQEAISFCAWVGEFLDTIQTKIAAKDQLDRASTSIPLNIAEGNGKFSRRDRARFLEMARRSALECAACLDVFVARKFTTTNNIIQAKEQLARVVQMLIGLLRRFWERADVLREEDAHYALEHEQEQDQA